MNTSIIDKGLATLKATKDCWATLSILDKISYLDQTIQLTIDYAEEWAMAGTEAKGLKQNSPLSGEEWLGGPYAFLNWMQYMKNTLQAINCGKSPIQNVKISERPNGQTVAQVYPNNLLEKVLLDNCYIDVWMQDGVTVNNIEDTVALFYKQENPQGKVSLVLGAGNVSSIVPLDIFYKLYAEGEVVIIKMNPINEYLGPIFEKTFAPLIENGFIQFAYGGADVGAYLTRHDIVDTIHITGSARTHDKIVFGVGEEGQKRKREKSPILKKPISSELGGVSPTIVVPGPWSKADLKFQAENIATQKLQNAGHNCVATQVLVMPKEWMDTEKLLNNVESEILKAEDRPAYYPGAADRQNLAREHANAKSLDSNVDRTIIYDLDSSKADLDQAIADLKYGGIGVNVWCALAFFAAGGAWGAFPGHSIDDIQSGKGVVHNAFLFDKTQKTVATGPFRNFPRSILSGDFHISPRPPWFVSNKTSHITGKRLTYYSGSGNWLKLPGILTSALRG